MTDTHTTQRPRSQQTWEFERPVPGGIVAGVDGSRESVAALVTASTIARGRHYPLHAVTVLPPFPSYHLIPAAGDSSDNVEQLRIGLKSAELRDLLARTGPGDDWTSEVAIGRPARVLTTIAEHRGAELIVLGHREHGVMDKVFGGETTLQVMRMASIPVLAVSSPLKSLRTVVVATDFSEAGIEAAKFTRELLGATGTLYLVYVEPPADLLPGGFTYPGETRFPGDVVIWFRRLTSELNPQAGLLIEPVVLNGNPVASITEFAKRVGADMIAAGSHGHTRIERFVLGSVSTGIVRNAHCPVLVVPHGNPG